MKLQQMLELVKKHHPDLGSNEMIHMLNKSSDEFCARTRLLDEATTFDTVSGKRFYGLKDDILEIKSVDMVNTDGDQIDIKRLLGRPKYRDIE